MQAKENNGSLLFKGRVLHSVVNDSEEDIKSKYTCRQISQ